MFTDAPEARPGVTDASVRSGCDSIRLRDRYDQPRGLWLDAFALNDLLLDASSCQPLRHIDPTG
ncbi:MAG: hypothetical protein WBK08_00480 [Nitrospira sp.]